MNIYQNLILLYKAHTGTAPSIFFNKFSKISHKYLTSSKNRGNFTILKSTMKLKKTSFRSFNDFKFNVLLLKYLLLFHMLLSTTTYITVSCLMIRYFYLLQFPATSYLFEYLSLKFTF